MNFLQAAQNKDIPKSKSFWELSSFWQFVEEAPRSIYYPYLDKDKQDQQKIEDICFIGFSDVSVLLNHTAEKGGWAIHSHVANTLRLASLKEQNIAFFSFGWKLALKHNKKFVVYICKKK